MSQRGMTANSCPARQGPVSNFDPRIWVGADSGRSGEAVNQYPDRTTTVGRSMYSARLTFLLPHRRIGARRAGVSQVRMRIRRRRTTRPIRVAVDLVFFTGRKGGT